MYVSYIYVHIKHTFSERKKDIDNHYTCLYTYIYICTQQHICIQIDKVNVNHIGLDNVPSAMHTEWCVVYIYIYIHIQNYFRYSECLHNTSLSAMFCCNACLQEAGSLIQLSVFVRCHLSSCEYWCWLYNSISFA